MSSAPPAKLSVIVFGTAPAVATFADAGAPVARAASSAAIEGTGSPSTMKLERHATDHVVGIAVHVQRADVASVSDRGALAGRGQHRMVLMLHLAEHDLAGARPERQRAQIVAVEAAHPRAQGLVAERHRRLLDRGREHDVEAHHLGAAVDDRGQHPADLAGPGDARRAFERRGAEGFLVERDHDRGRGRRLCALPKARQRSVVSRSIDRPRTVSSAGEAATRAATSAIRKPAAARAGGRSMDARWRDQPDGKRTRRLTTGAGPDLALASILNVILRPPSVAL